jgi:hypothetical protein
MLLLLNAREVAKSGLFGGLSLFEELERLLSSLNSTLLRR